MGLLSWLGLQRGGDYPNLDALHAALKTALPNDEAVVVRYIAVVVALLGRIACADGRFTEEEEKTLRDLLAHVDRLSASGVEAVCTALHGKIPSMSEQEISACYHEIKALCDGAERRQVLRLLVQLAASDGGLKPEEDAELRAIANEMGVPPEEIEGLAR
jgi:tellurite resistance protein